MGLLHPPRIESTVWEGAHGGIYKSRRALLGIQGPLKEPELLPNSLLPLSAAVSPTPHSVTSAILPLEMPSFPSCISLFLQALPPNPWQVDLTHLLTLNSTRLYSSRIRANFGFSVEHSTM